ncbi:MAG: hypothetical protein EAZ95_03635 [Bacteroidetes bacterium]|nr:MAG: hypothetical protein EAZ95_03635 [Bacteroidota bacterium]
MGRFFGFDVDSAYICSMKISIKNFGPIHEFSLDLTQDLQLIYGKNSVGKSYAMNIVYIVLKNLQNNLYSYNAESDRQLTDISKAFMLSDPTKNLITGIKRILDLGFAKSLQESIERNHTDIRNIQNQKNTENQKYVIQIETDLFILSIGNGDYDSFEVLNFDFKSYFRAKIKPYNNIDEHEIIIGKENDKQAYFNIVITLDSIERNYHYRIIFDMFVVDVKKEINEMLFLPASRSGLHYLLEQGIYDFSKFPEPIADYIKKIKELNSNERRGKYLPIVKDMENNMLDYSIKYDKNKIIYLHKKNNILSLKEASSMESELVFIISLLKFNSEPEKEIIHKKTVLFIEEPEAHLHPEMQVIFMSFLVRLTQEYNVKIIMTSHSNYMFNELSNLILEKKIAYEKVACYHMIMTDEGSIDAQDMLVTEEGIDDNNFVATSEKLYEKRMEIYEKLNAQNEL